MGFLSVQTFRLYRWYVSHREKKAKAIETAFVRDKLTGLQKEYYYKFINSLETCDRFYYVSGRMLLEAKDLLISIDVVPMACLMNYTVIHGDSVKHIEVRFPDDTEAFFSSYSRAYIEKKIQERKEYRTLKLKAALEEV